MHMMTFDFHSRILSLFLKCKSLLLINFITHLMEAFLFAIKYICIPQLIQKKKLPLCIHKYYIQQNILQKMKNCVVLNCDHFEPAKYVFPNPGKHPELFCKWIQLCGNPRLTERNPNTIQANEKLCINHFKDSDFTSKGKLLRKSIPSLNLPGYF